MQNFVRNVKVLTGAEEVVRPISIPQCGVRNSRVRIISNEKSGFGDVSAELHRWGGR